MIKPAVAALVAALLVPGTALAQTPDTTPPDAVLKIDTTLQSIDSMIGNGLTFSADPSEDLTYTAKATIKVKKKTYVVAKSVREGQLYNQSGGFVEQSIARGSDSAVKQLVKIKGQEGVGDADARAQGHGREHEDRDQDGQTQAPVLARPPTRRPRRRTVRRFATGRSRR